MTIMNRTPFKSNQSTPSTIPAWMLALGMTALLSACGGGGGGGNATQATDASNGGTTLTADAIKQADTYDLQTTVPEFTYQANSWQRAAHTYLNEQRSRCGFGLLKQSAPLETAAQGHSDYLSRIVKDKVTTQYPYLSQQDPGRPLYTGKSLADRTAAAGYVFGLSNEVYEAPNWRQSLTASEAEKETLKSDAAIRSIRKLLATSYSLEFMAPYSRFVGFGLSTANPNETSPDLVEGRFVVTLGRGLKEQASFTETLSYPCEGISGVEVGHFWDYWGDPTEGQGVSLPIGRGILVVAPFGATLKIQTASITPVAFATDTVLNSKPLSSVPAYIYGSASPSGIMVLSGTDAAGFNHRKEVAVLHAHKPLEFSVTYRVDLAFTVNGSPKTKTFQFTTKKQSE
jgi:hypothetical protein